jgi:hypothetical protein
MSAKREIRGASQFGTARPPDSLFTPSGLHAVRLLATSSMMKMVIYGEKPVARMTAAKSGAATQSGAADPGFRAARSSALPAVRFCEVIYDEKGHL